MFSDGCIFVWRLFSELIEFMKGRLEEMGKFLMEAVNGDINRWVGGVWVGLGVIKFYGCLYMFFIM